MWEYVEACKSLRWLEISIKFRIGIRKQKEIGVKKNK